MGLNHPLMFFNYLVQRRDYETEGGFVQSKSAMDVSYISNLEDSAGVGIAEFIFLTFLCGYYSIYNIITDPPSSNKPT